MRREEVDAVSIGELSVEPRVPGGGGHLVLGEEEGEGPIEDGGEAYGLHVTCM